MTKKILCFVFVLTSANTFAQDIRYKLAQNVNEERTAYLKTITLRAEKIVSTLWLKSKKKERKIVSIIKKQFDDLNDVYRNRDIEFKNIRTEIKDKAKIDTLLVEKDLEAQKKAAELHDRFLHKLKKHLTRNEIEKVKNWMTYNIAIISYKGYLEEILTLNEEQKKQIWDWLAEAREHAMYAGSADEKIAWFWKYRIKINNYLSGLGYNLNKF